MQPSTAQYSLIHPRQSPHLTLKKQQVRWGTRLHSPQYRPQQPSTAQYSPVHSRTAKYSQVERTTAQYIPLQPEVAHYSPVQPSASQYSPVQPITSRAAQYSPEHPSRAQYSPVQPIALSPCHSVTPVTLVSLDNVVKPIFLFRNRIAYLV